MRKWWNWQTHHLEGVAAQAMRVQVPPSAPVFEFLEGKVNSVADRLILENRFGF